MNTCRKTHWKYAVAELIWKVGEKLEVQGMKATGGDHIFGVGKYPADIECTSMGMGWNLVSETWIMLSKKPCNLNGNERMVKLPGRIPLKKDCTSRGAWYLNNYFLDFF